MKKRNLAFVILGAVALGRARDLVRGIGPAAGLSPDREWQGQERRNGKRECESEAHATSL